MNNEIQLTFLEFKDARSPKELPLPPVKDKMRLS